MAPLLTHQATISWEVTVVEITREGTLSPFCPSCQTPLNLHQPDESHPNRLLGTCGDCGTWFLIEIGSRSLKSLMVSMPGVNFVRAQLKETGKTSGNSRRSKTRTES